MLPVRRSDETIDDLVGIWCDVAQHNVPAADRLITEIDRLFGHLGNHPLIGERCVVRPERYVESRTAITSCITSCDVTPSRSFAFCTVRAITKNYCDAATASATTVPSQAVNSAKSFESRCVTGPIVPVPITRPSTRTTSASSPIVPVQNISSAR